MLSQTEIPPASKAARIISRDAAEAVSALLAGKVPMARRTRYENGAPVASEWLKVRITKRDRFFRANGKIVSRNMAAWAIRAGVAEIAPQAA